MPLGNQYGIDLGNILSAESAIKTARLNRKSKELGIGKEIAGRKLRKDVIDVGTNILQSKEAMTAKGIEGPEVKPLETLPQEEINRLSSIAPKAAEDIKSQQRQDSLTKYYEAKGMPKDEAVLRASGFNKEISDFNKEFQTKDTATQQNIKNNLAQQGQAIDNVITVSKDNPQVANKMFTDYRADTNEQIKTLLREGKTKEADALQSSLDKLPSSLIKPDGSFDTEFLGISLMKIGESLTGAESWEKQQLSTTKQENLLALERERQKRPSKTGTSKQERLVNRKLDLEDKIDSETITDRERKELNLINKSMEKSTQIREGVSERGMTKTNEMMSNLSKSINVTDFFDFSDKITSGEMSISGLNTTQKKDLGKIARREQSVTKNRIDKDDKSTLSALKQTTNVIDVMKGADFTENYGPIDKYTDDVLKYFRGDENAAKSAMISAFVKASTVNANIKGVPSNADLKMIAEGLADRTMNEDQAAKMMVAALEKDLAEAKDTLDRAIISAPATAIFKYGDVVSDLKKSISIINQAFGQTAKDVKKTDRLSELRKAKQAPRQAMYDQIKAQRPSATDAQINNYLTSKGY